MPRPQLIASPLLLAYASLTLSAPAASVVVQPYVQLGDHPKLANKESLSLLWHTSDEDGDWSVELKTNAAPSEKASDEIWQKMNAPSCRKVRSAGIAPERVCSVELKNLTPGEKFDYRLMDAGKPVFQATAQARKAANQFFRAVIFGDCGQDTAPQRQIAYQAYQQKPDFVLIPGDIVYGRGRESEYLVKYFPIYNANSASAATGAPLLRSTLFVAAVGNHDSGSGDLDRSPDTLAYFYNWSQPMNGPFKTAQESSVPALTGSAENQKAFLDAASSSFPGMAMFSFDYGNAHWTVIDSNKYVDWNSPALRDWLDKDLKSAKDAKWRFVTFHHPGFNSAKEHLNDQWMRGVADLFEKDRVDVVFSGHVHNYQRTHPLKFVAKAGGFDKSSGILAGIATLDKEFDGKTRTKPNGVLYVITGAGGATLYNPEQQKMPETWLPFTDKFISEVNSMTVLDVRDDKLSFQQISAAGAVLDAFVITK